MKTVVRGIHSGKPAGKLRVEMIPDPRERLIGLGGGQGRLAWLTSTMWSRQGGDRDTGDTGEVERSWVISVNAAEETTKGTVTYATAHDREPGLTT